MDAYELSEKLFDMILDMDAPDYEDVDQTKMDIENALYNLKAIKNNEYNSNYWRTFWLVLEKITEIYG